MLIAIRSSTLGESRFGCLSAVFFFLALLSIVVSRYHWHYREGLYMEFTREQAIRNGTFVCDMEWKLEPDSAFEAFNFELTSVYCVQTVGAKNGWVGFEPYDPPDYCVRYKWKLNGFSDSLRYVIKIDGAKRLDWPFFWYYGGGAGTCWNFFHPDSNGYRSVVSSVLDSYALLEELNCIPSYFRMIGHLEGPGYEYQTFTDTLFVLHVWRKGLKWPDVKKLAVPNEEQERVNHERNERWWNSRTQAEVDSMDEKRAKYLRIWRRDRQWEQEAEQKRREAAGG